jgi:hypothetical protein
MTLSCDNWVVIYDLLGDTVPGCWADPGLSWTLLGELQVTAALRKSSSKWMPHRNPNCIARLQMLCAEPGTNVPYKLACVCADLGSVVARGRHPGTQPGGVILAQQADVPAVDNFAAFW